MTDAEIRASKWEHWGNRMDIRDVVQMGTPSRLIKRTITLPGSGLTHFLVPKEWHDENCGVAQ